MSYLFNFWRCWRKPHMFINAGESLGGWWVECRRCHYVDEYIPGLHEPHGFYGEFVE